MKPMSLLALSILLVTGGCILGPGDELPEPDDCSSPNGLAGIEAIEVGTMEEINYVSRFVPWQGIDVVELSHGSQGGTMLGVVLSLRGGSLPACMRHSMELTWNGNRLASTEYPVRTYPVQGGTRKTGTIFLIFEDGMYPEQGDELELVLQAGSFEIRRSLLIEAPQPRFMRVVEGPSLFAGGEYTLEIDFDRWIFSDVTVTIESSDPEVLRPLSPTLQVSQSIDGYAASTALEALAPGGPVTISVTANGHTIAMELVVQ